jgi:hypothetical protein
MARGGGCSPFQISLRVSERRALKRVARSQAAPHRQVVRARIVLDAAAGLPNALIARRVGVAPNTVRKWRKRFCAHGMRDRPRPGPPAGVRGGGGRRGQGDRLRAARHPQRAINK